MSIEWSFLINVELFQDTKVLTVNLNDANDNVPTCDKSIYNTAVNENEGTGILMKI